MFAATITTTEIRDAFNAIRDGSSTITDGQFAPISYAIASDRYDSWYQASGKEMADALNHGATPSITPDVTIGGGEDAPRPTLVYDDEEGDLMVDAVLSGEDDYRVQWSETPAPVSIRIVAQVNMLSDTPGHVLTEYQDFIMGAVDAAANLGGAPGLEIVHYVRRAIQRESACRFYIPLVEPGEMVDRTAWSAFFSPGGFRMLGFLARAVAAKREGRKLGSGMGASSGPGWNVSREGDTITITCPPSARSFPREHMEELLADACNAA
jgi:hypothetical protein